MCDVALLANMLSRVNNYITLNTPLSFEAPAIPRPPVRDIFVVAVSAPTVSALRLFGDGILRRQTLRRWSSGSQRNATLRMPTVCCVDVAITLLRIIMVVNAYNWRER